MDHHLRVARWGTIFSLAVLGAACSTQAPRYQPSIDNVELLKKASGPVAIGAFTVKAGTPEAASIGLRGSSMVSPVGKDYAAYLGDALRQELELAGKLDPKSQIEIGGVLTKNELNAAGISSNDGTLEAQFVVKKAGEVRYSKSKRATTTWESSFVGAIAIPKAQQQYPVIVQKLLTELLGDADFMAALK